MGKFKILTLVSSIILITLAGIINAQEIRKMLRATVDVLEEEIDIADNEKEIEVITKSPTFTNLTEPETEGINLAATDISISPVSLTTSSFVSVWTVVKNKGEIAVNNIEVSLYRLGITEDGGISPILVETHEVERINSGEEVRNEFKIWVEAPKEDGYYLYLVAKVSSVEGEKILWDNSWATRFHITLEDERIRILHKENVHEKLVEHAAEIFGKNLLENFEKIKSGAKDEDHTDPIYGYDFVPTVTHFWDADPSDGDEKKSDFGWLIGEYENAWQKTKQYWWTIKSFYSRSDGESKGEAYRRLGRVAHLLADMGVPAHAHIDSHATYVWWIFVGDDSYEEWMKDGHTKWNYQHALNAGGLISIPWDKKPLDMKEEIFPFGIKDDLFPLYYLFYTVNQHADHFASDGVDGDDNYSANRKELWEHGVNSGGWGGPTRKGHLDDNDWKWFFKIEWDYFWLGPKGFRTKIWYPVKVWFAKDNNDDDGDLSRIGDKAYVYSIRAVATLYKFFWDTANPPKVNWVQVEPKEENNKIYKVSCKATSGIAKIKSVKFQYATDSEWKDIGSGTFNSWSDGNEIWEIDFNPADFGIANASVKFRALATNYGENTTPTEVQPLRLVRASPSAPGIYQPTLVDPTPVATVIIDNAPPSVPVLSSPTDGFVANTNKPSFDWQDSVDPEPGVGLSHYQLEILDSEERQVKFFDNITSSDYTLTTSLFEGTYFWRVRAIDKNGISSSWSEKRKVEIDVTPPTVRISKPLNSGFVRQEMTPIDVFAEDNIEISRVEFYIDGALWNTDTDIPYSWNWDTTNYSLGTKHIIEVIAYDTAGNKNSHEIQVVITKEGYTFNYTIIASVYEYPSISSITISCSKDVYSSSWDDGYWDYYWWWKYWVPVLAVATEFRTYISQYVTITWNEPKTQYVEMYVERQTSSGGWETIWTCPGGQAQGSMDVYIIGTRPHRIKIRSPVTGEQANLTFFPGSGQETGQGSVAIEEGYKRICNSRFSPSPLYGMGLGGYISWNNNYRYYYFDPVTYTGVTVSFRVDDDSPKVITSIPHGDLYAQIDKQSPSVSITAPYYSRTRIKGVNTVRATIQDNEKISKVNFRIDGDVRYTVEPTNFDCWYYKLAYCDWAWNTAVDSDGEHRVEVVAYDPAENIGYMSRTVVTDNTPPQITIFSPKTSDKYIGILDKTKIDFTVSDLEPHPQVSSYLKKQYWFWWWSWWETVPVSNFQVIDPSNLDAGYWYLVVRATDWVGNVTEVQTQFEIIHDVRPPRTSLSLGEPKYIIGNTYVRSDTPFSLKSIDDLLVANDNQGVGVSSTVWGLSGGISGVIGNLEPAQGKTFAPSPVYLASVSDGSKTFFYFSEDRAKNREGTKAFPIILDNTPPVSEIYPSLPLYTTATVNFASGRHYFGLSAKDPLSGVKRISYSLDSENFANYSEPFSFSKEGIHSVRYKAIDNLDNEERENEFNIIIDTSAPNTDLIYGEPNYQNFITSQTPLAIFAVDEGVLPSGINLTQYLINQEGIWKTPPAEEPFFLNGIDGQYVFYFYSEDNVSNREGIKAKSLFLDNTPPVTSLTIGSPQYTSAGNIWITSATGITLSASDVGSGIQKTEYKIDTGNWVTYTSAFTIDGEGSYTIYYRSQDKVDNLESTKQVTVIVDNTSPNSSISVGSPKSTEYVTSQTSFTLASVDGGVILCGVQYVEYRINSGSWQNYTQAFYLSGTDGNYTIDYRASDNVSNLEAYKSLSIKLDNTPPVAKLEVRGMKYELEGKTYIRPDTEIILSALDPVINEVASGVSRIQWLVDSGEWLVYKDSFTLEEGVHTIKYYSVDNLGNNESVHIFTFYVDATVPITDLDIGDDSSLLVSGRTPFTLTAYDPIIKEVASGVRNTFYRVAETTSVPFSVYTSSFTLSPPDGDKLVEYCSIDNVENIEAVKSVTFTLDNTEPEVKIISPSNDNIGLCRIVNGTTTIVGSVSDLHFKWYRLEYKAVIGNGEWVMVKDKTYQEVNEEILATWDTSSLTEGWYKIRLTAEDCVKNQASDEVEIYIGKPKLKLSFGKIGNASGEFNSPSYIVRDSSGNIWISDTNNDRIQKFDSEGKWLATLGGENSDKKKEKTVTFNKPTGLAIDSGSNLYVADRNNDRVLKFSVEDSTGTSPYTTKIISGFNKPHGLAVDKEDNLYVADRNNDRIQKFDKDGNLLLTINTGVGFGDGSASLTTSLNKPQGVMAITEEQIKKLYVSDRNNDRILVYELTDSTDTTVQTVITGFNKPDGIAVNSLGYFYVTDTNNDRIQKFDRYGNFVMSFGGSSEFNKPAGIILDEQGNLYVVDSNNGQVKVFGLPDSSRIAAASPITYSPSPITEFVLGEYYSFPNPVKYGNPPAGGPTIHFECGLADKVEIRIYDLAGDLVHSTEISGDRYLVMGNRYAYEYAWDISDVASGIYIYCIQAKKSGYPDIKVRKKLAVIK